MADREIVLYHIPQSRSITALWMLEELGRPYRIEQLDINRNEQRGARYLTINPSGKVPAIVDDGIVITERGAICIHLADRHAPGRLTPTIDDQRRPDYLRWMFYAAGVVEPLLTIKLLKLDIQAPPGAVAWGDYDTMIAILRSALKDKPWFLGEQFTAADIFLGSMIVWGIAVGVVPKEPILEAYADRAAKRPGYQRTVQKDGTR